MAAIVDTADLGCVVHRELGGWIQKTHRIREVQLPLLVVCLEVGKHRCQGRPKDINTTLSPPLNVNIAQTGNFIAAGDLGNRQGAAAGVSAVFPISLLNDDTDEPNGSMTCTLLAGDGYRLASTSSATIPIVDDDPTVVSLARTGSGGA